MAAFLGFQQTALPLSALCVGRAAGSYPFVGLIYLILNQDIARYGALPTRQHLVFFRLLLAQARRASLIMLCYFILPCQKAFDVGRYPRVVS